MSPEIYRETPANIKAWEELTGNSFVNSPGFVSIWTEQRGRGVFIIGEKDGRYRAGIALIIFGRAMWRRIETMPSGLPGGFFFADDMTSDERQDFLKTVLNIIKGYHPWRIVINNGAENLTSFGFMESRSRTHLLALGDNREESISPKVREHLHAAVKRGARVEPFSDSGDLKQFYELAKKAEFRHGQTLRYSFRFFKELWELSQSDSRIIWLKAMHDGQMIASRISFVERDYLINWQLYMDRNEISFKPGYLLMDHVIRHAGEINLKHINLGGSPKDAQSLRDYKENWGGRETEASYYIHHNLLGRLFFKRGRR